MLRLAECNKI